ncbi:MAG: FlgD immunoglobulin-like domain containing protein, partial [Candidatus Poribacteria bacterium]
VIPLPVPVYPSTCPVFVQRSNWIHDPLSGGDGDGKAESGEQVTSKIRVKNDSAIPGQKVFATFTTDDPHITIVKARRGVGTWAPGTVRVFDFILDIAPDATEHAADATVTLTMAGCRPTVFPIQIPINPVVRFVQRNAFARDKVTGDNDGNAETGEQIEMRVRLKNEGQLVGKNVVVTLSTSDSNVTIPSPTVMHPTWPAGVARNNLGLVVDLGAGVGSSVAFVVDVTADNGGPWQFTFDLPVAAAAAPSALVSGIPAVSVLLPNYPNPFNPETWIPFGLAEGADVTVTIYNMVGAPVRRIDLGYLEPGVYESRREAAHWDGRNALGERVASGVYIYELRAGDFREIRRMLVRK